MASGHQLSEENVAAFMTWSSSKSDDDFREYVHRGRLKRSEIAAECGFGKSALVQNPAIRAALEALEDALRERGVLPLASTGDEAPVERVAVRDKEAKQRWQDAVRLNSLEQENAALRAELTKAKAMLERYKLLSSFIEETGRYVLVLVCLWKKFIIGSWRFCMLGKILQASYYPIRLLSFLGGFIVIYAVFDSVPAFFESALLSRFPILGEYVVIEYIAVGVIFLFVAAMAIPTFVMAIYTINAICARGNIVILMFVVVWAVLSIVADLFYQEYLAGLSLFFLVASYPAIMLFDVDR